MSRILLLVILLVSLQSCDVETWHTKKFDAATWSASPEGKRYEFAKDLLSSRRLIGLKKEEVIDLLGPPSPYSDLPNLDYVIKTDGNGFNQVFILDIRFADGKVHEVLIRGD